MGAMMTPSAIPTIRLYGTLADSRRVLTWFAATYVAMWCAIGFAGAAATELAPSTTSLGLVGTQVTALTLAAAAVYQLTAAKRSCLIRCRSPLGWMLRNWRDGRVGAMLMGLRYSGWCAGCCIGLLVALLAVGVMNVVWMIAVMFVILAEKVSPIGHRASSASSAGLFALATAFALDPQLVQWLM
jgi:predicted metal-binding membrane protein